MLFSWQFIGSVTKLVTHSMIQTIVISTTICLRDRDHNLYWIHKLKFENGIMKCLFRDTHLSVGEVVNPFPEQ
jgi:hypothetical protein